MRGDLWRAGAWLAWAASLASCGGGASTPVPVRLAPPDTAGIVTSVRMDHSGEPPSLSRIDGSVLEFLPARLWDPADSTVVVTGSAGGSDQHSLIAFDGNGRRQAKWRPSGESPFRRFQNQKPAGRHTRPLSLEGRHFLTTVTDGLYFPATVSVLEAVSGPALEERMVFWNCGSIGSYEVKGTTLAFRGVNNNFREETGNQYSVVVGVLDLAAVLKPGVVAVGTSPLSDSRPGSGYVRYFVLPLDDRSEISESVSILSESSTVRVSMAAGISFLADLKTGACRFEASPKFRETYEASRTPGRVPVDEYLRNLASSVRAWPRP